MSGDIFIDATIFLGMHSRNEPARRACKAFFVHRFAERICMSLEHVGLCDDVLWAAPRNVQDEYFPFMDVLHTDMKIERRAYAETDLLLAQEWTGLSELPPHQRLLVAMAAGAGGTVVSLSPALVGASVAQPPAAAEREPCFPGQLEDLYQASLAFRVPEGIP